MQIGFVGPGKMGGNMVHRIRRDSRMLAALPNQVGGHAVTSVEKEQAA